MPMMPLIRCRRNLRARSPQRARQCACTSIGRCRSRHFSVVGHRFRRACLASCATRPVRRSRYYACILASFKGTTEDEAPLAARVAQQIRRTTYRSAMSTSRNSAATCRYSRCHGPAFDRRRQYLVCCQGSEGSGLKVAISGLGGDELLAGYPSFVDVPRWHRRFGRFCMPGVGRIARSFIRAFAPESARSHPKLLGAVRLCGHHGRCVSASREACSCPTRLSELDGCRFCRGKACVGSIRSSDCSPISCRNLKSDVARVCALESTHYHAQPASTGRRLGRDGAFGRDQDAFGRLYLVKSMAPLVPSFMDGRGKLALAKSASRPLPDEIMSGQKPGLLCPRALG